MKIELHQIYHIYNQGNNRQPIFFKPENYAYFMGLVERHILPRGDLLGYCLMPNHFHFIIHSTKESVQLRKSGLIEISNLSFGFKTLLSCHAQHMNHQLGRSGSLFRQKTKAKCLTKPDSTPKIKSIHPFSTYHPLKVLHYMHLNPVRAGLVKKPEDWIFSSFREYEGLGFKQFCDLEKARCLQETGPKPSRKTKTFIGPDNDGNRIRP